MATILAAASGNWNATGTWTGGVVPTAGDIAVANGRTVTINQDITVAELRNDTTGGATTGGSYTITANRIINANIIGGGGPCCVFSATGSLTINGSITGSTSNTNNVGLSVNGSSQTVNFANGTLSQGASSSNGAPAASFSISSGNTVVDFASTCSISITTAQRNVINLSFSGSATANITVSCPINLSSGNGYGLNITAESNNVITLVCTSSISATLGTGFGVVFSGSNASNSFSYTGSISVANGTGIWLQNGGTTTITGSMSSTGGAALRNEATGTINIVGDITGGTGASQTLNSYTYTQTSSAATTTLTGITTAGTKGSACSITAGTFYAVRATGNGFGQGSVNINNCYAISNVASTTAVSVSQIECGSLGAFPINGSVKLLDSPSNIFIAATTTNTQKTLLDINATTGVLPTQENVRLGVVYSNGTRTGTCAVPPAESVSAGVPVDNTTGTAAITSEAITQACSKAIVPALLSLG